MSAAFHVRQKHSPVNISTLLCILRHPTEETINSLGFQWTALLEANDPKEILSNSRLVAAREEVNLEVEKKTHTPPKFSKDGKIALLKIESKAQVHPVIATRWVSIFMRKH